MGDREIVRQFFESNAGALKKLWYESVLEAYPPETAKLLSSRKDQFSNPVGYTLKTMIDEVVDGLSAGAGLEDISEAFFPLIRIKAVQGFTPAESVSCVLALKRAVRELSASGPSGDGGGVLQEMDELTDSLLCSCFDLYVECRQKLSEIKEEELKRNLYMLLKKADLVEGRTRGDG